VKSAGARASARARVIESEPYEVFGHCVIQQLATQEQIQDVLSNEDASFLEDREARIESGRQTFLEVGRALCEIRAYKDGLLYKAYGSFDAYCKARWDFGRSYAYRLMNAAQIRDELSPRGDSPGELPLPVTEKQVRALTRLQDKPDRLKAWKAAVKAAGTRPVSASIVAREVKKLLPKSDPKKGSAKRNLLLTASVIAEIRQGLAEIAAANGNVSEIKKLIAKIQKRLPA